MKEKRDEIIILRLTKTEKTKFFMAVLFMAILPIALSRR